MLAIFYKEINHFFSSLIGYVAIIFFLVLTGLWVWVWPENNTLDQGYGDLQIFFHSAPYIFLFLIPSLTMRTFAEEKKMKTLALLQISPLSTTKIILGKYLALLSILGFILLLTFPYYITIYCLSQPTGHIDTASIITAYIGLWLLGSTYMAIGIGISTCTKNQIVAFLMSSLVCFLWYQGFNAWATLQSWQHYALWIESMGGIYRYQAFSWGMIEGQHLFYFFFINSIFLFFAKNKLNNLC